jgi:hypothetical protein
LDLNLVDLLSLNLAPPIRQQSLTTVLESIRARSSGAHAQRGAAYYSTNAR